MMDMEVSAPKPKEEGPSAPATTQPRRASIALLLGACLLALLSLARAAGGGPGGRPRPPPAAAAATATFDDVTGRPLDAAAEELVAAATHARGRVVGVGAAGGDDASRHDAAGAAARCDALADVPPVDIARGTWKYVLIALSAPGCEGEEKVVVRNSAGLAYHGHMYEAAMRELAPRGIRGHVLGGGRIVYDAADGGDDEVEIYGYSKTFGRCESCNEMAAKIIKQDDAFEGVQVRWSNEGY